MSASTEKKLRQAAREAGTDKRTLAMEKEAKEKARQKRRWTLGTIAVVLLIAFIFFLNSALQSYRPYHSRREIFRLPDELSIQ